MHPATPRKTVREFVEGRKAGLLAAHDLTSQTNGSSSVDWISDVNDTLDAVLEQWTTEAAAAGKSDQARDGVEGSIAITLHRGLMHLPAEVLTDRDFWRYCSAYLYDFVTWRQTSDSIQALYPYFGVATGSLGRECVPHRMFGRAQIALAGGELAGDADPYAHAKIAAADVWKSHILRVRHGDAPRVVYEMLKRVEAGALKTDVVRPLARDLRRVRSNVIFEILDQDQADSLIERETGRTKSVPLD